MLAYDLVGKWLPDDLRLKMAELIRALATGYLAVQPNTRKGTTVNNWQSHRVKLITLSAFALNDPRVISSAQRALQTQLDYNLRTDGSTVDFEQRDALHYVVYDLEPLSHRRPRREGPRTRLVQNEKPQWSVARDSVAVARALCDGGAHPRGIRAYYRRV